MISIIESFFEKDGTIKNIQKFSPLYQSLSIDSNYTILHDKTIDEIIERISYNDYMIKTKNDKEIIIFMKYAPLLDPLNYITGSYDDSYLCNPKIGHPCSKMMSEHNSAYVDTLFYILCDKLNIPHSVDFYGTFIGSKQLFEYDVSDDLDVLEKSMFFHKYNGIKFNIENYETIFNMNETRKNKKIINIKSKSKTLKLDVYPEYIDSLFDINNKNSKLSDINVLYEIENSENDDYDYDEGDEETYMKVTIPSFPIQSICLEKLESTLDEYIESSELSNDEWLSIFGQIIMMLIIYQKTFAFTHNDLHTSNIMYSKTSKTYIIYKWNNKYFKFKTYGKIYKIIDFGRSIYEYNGKRYCSDSYHQVDGDASMQYNCEPFLNKNEPIIEPNFSFDICRLGCSLYDHFIQNDKDIFDDKIFNLIREWCLDDNNENVLYENDFGKERYPGFQLYKMITRTVHNHIPKNVIQNDIFVPYIINEYINNEENDLFINIDEIN